MALSEDQKRLLWHYHDFLRDRALTICERVEGADGVVRHRNVRVGRGQDLISGFARWLEQGGSQREQTAEQSEKEGAGG